MSSRSRLLAGAAALVALTFGSTAAFGLPWDLDMVDAQYVRGYERLMRPLPEGVVSQPNTVSPKAYAPVYPIPSAQTAALVSPYDSSPEVLAKGEKMYQTYCTPCHGDGVALGPLSAPGRVPAIPALSGADGRLHKLTDGWIYMTIRQGSISKIMPAYGYTMTTDEQWAIVHYLRTMDNGAYIPPAPAAPAEGTATPGVTP